MCCCDRVNRQLPRNKTSTMTCCWQLVLQTNICHLPSRNTMLTSVPIWSSHPCLQVFSAPYIMVLNFRLSISPLPIVTFFQWYQKRIIGDIRHNIWIVIHPGSIAYNGHLPKYILHPSCLISVTSIYFVSSGDIHIFVSPIYFVTPLNEWPTNNRYTSKLMPRNCSQTKSFM